MGYKADETSIKISRSNGIELDRWRLELAMAGEKKRSNRELIEIVMAHWQAEQALTDTDREMLDAIRTRLIRGDDALRIILRHALDAGVKTQSQPKKSAGSR